MKKMKILALLLGATALFSSCSMMPATENSSSNFENSQSSEISSVVTPTDTARFTFDNPNEVGVCYEYMTYPFEQSRDYVQIWAGNDENSPNCTYKVDGSLQINMSDSLISYTNICFRVYSTEFDNKNVGDKVKVSVKFKLNPDTAWDLFLGVRNENGGEGHHMNSKLPITGSFEKYEWVTQIENSNAFYFNNPSRINRNNIQFAFFRVAVGEVFAIDSIDFEFID